MRKVPLEFWGRDPGDPGDGWRRPRRRAAQRVFFVGIYLCVYICICISAYPSEVVVFLGLWAHPNGSWEVPRYPGSFSGKVAGVRDV